MAGIINKTARLLHVRCIVKKKVVLMRLAPGFNRVEDKVFKCFVDGKKVDPYLKELEEKEWVSFGPEAEKKGANMAKELQSDAHTEVKALPPKMAKTLGQGADGEGSNIDDEL